MSRSGLNRYLLLIFLLCCAYRGYAQATGSISGSVRDTSGAALAGIPLSLSEDPSRGTSLHTFTDKFGVFHFDHLALKTYRLSADGAGDRVEPSGPFTLNAAISALHLDLRYTRASASEPTSTTLQLQAAGIRGYIDPGGYSAPAGAAAASTLLQNAASLNRPESASTSAGGAGCVQEAILMKAVLDHPDSAADHRQLGRYYLARHRQEKALTELQRAHALDASDPQTLVSLAEALLQARQFPAAHDLLMSDTTGADKAAIHRLLAQAYEGQGAFAQASREYQRAAALEPTIMDFYGAGYELILAGSPAAAVKVFESGVTHYPDSMTLLIGIGTADFLQGRTGEATHIFLHCAKLHADDARLYPFLSASFAVSGSERDAVEASFRSYHLLHPDRADAAYFYGLIRLGRGTTGTESPAAETLFQDAVRLDPGYAKAHRQLGTIYLDRLDYTDAAEEFSTALDLDPKLWETHYKLSTAYRRMGQTDLANRQMQLFLASKSQNSAGDRATVPDLEEFLSVLAKPDPKSSLATSCVTLK